MKKEIKSLEEIKAVLSEKKTELETKFNIKELGVFGSYVRDPDTPVKNLGSSNSIALQCILWRIIF